MNVYDGDQPRWEDEGLTPFTVHPGAPRATLVLIKGGYRGQVTTIFQALIRGSLVFKQSTQALKRSGAGDRTDNPLFPRN